MNNAPLSRKLRTERRKRENNLKISIQTLDKLIFTVFINLISKSLKLITVSFNPCCRFSSNKTFDKFLNDPPLSAQS